MNTLNYIQKRFNLDLSKKFIEIPDTNRETLAELFCELGYEIGAEVGVEEGKYSEVICRKNPNVQLFSIDAWEAYRGYREHVTQEKLDRIYETAKEKLKPFNATLIKGYSLDVVKDFEDESLDFVYIDGNHAYEHAVNDISAWSKKVRKGGIVAGHDYIKRKGNSYLIGVVPAVNGFVEAYKISPLFILGRKETIEGERRDRSRSWFYVKQ